MASMLRNLSLGASHAAAALEGFSVAQQMGTGQPPYTAAPAPAPAYASAAPAPTGPPLASPRPGQQPSLSAASGTAPGLRIPPFPHGPGRGGAPPSVQPSVTVRIQRSPRPSAPTAHNTPAAPPSAAPHSAATAPSSSAHTDHTQGQDQWTQQPQPQVDLANIIGSVMSGVQSMQNGQVCKSLS
jgi:hypothetical protein